MHDCYLSLRSKITSDLQQVHIVYMGVVNKRTTTNDKDHYFGHTCSSPRQV
jgi:hypothetical protein